MTVTAAFSQLEHELRQLEHVIGNIAWAVVQGRPASADGRSIADHYESATIDFKALANTARQAAHNGCIATTDHGDLFTLRQSLAACQEHANLLMQQYYGDLAACERIADLDDLVIHGSRDWAKWVLGVRDGLSSCPHILHAISGALLQCWQEITEPIGPMSVSAQATSVGTRIVIRGPHELEASSATPSTDGTVHTPSL